MKKLKQGRRYKYTTHKAQVEAELAWRKRAKECELRLSAKYRAVRLSTNL